MTTRTKDDAADRGAERMMDRVWVYLTRAFVITWLPMAGSAAYWIINNNATHDQRLALIEASIQDFRTRSTISRDELALEVARIKLEIMERNEAIANKLIDRMNKQDEVIKSMPSAEFRNDYNELKRLVSSNNDTLVRMAAKLDLAFDSAHPKSQTHQPDTP